jgi:hypothetical protein
MSIRVEIYTAGGIAVGVLPRASHLRDALEAGESLRVEAVTWHPLDDTAAGQQAEVMLAPDDIHLATVEESEDLPVHAQWHDIVLDVGPYRVLGQLATMPGFDPGRALARPTGEFVQLRDVSVGLLAEDAERAEGLSRPMALVNRYVVDRVEADLMLGFFFPGAQMISTKTEEPIFITSTPSPSTSSAPATPTATTTADGGTDTTPPSGDAGEPATDQPGAAPAASAEVATAAPATEGA